MKNYWEALFDDFMDLTEFKLVKYPDGWGVIDAQGANFGDIENDRFKNAAGILDRMEIYEKDYIIDGLVQQIEAMEEANKQFEGIHSFCDNGCVDRLIGVYGDNDETIEESGCVEFDNCVEKS